MGDESLWGLSKLGWSKKSQSSDRAGSVKKNEIIFITMELLLQIILFLLSSLTCKSSKWNMVLMQLFLLLAANSGRENRGEGTKERNPGRVAKLEVNIFCRNFPTVIKKILPKKQLFLTFLQSQFFNSTEKIYESGPTEMLKRILRAAFCRNHRILQ